MQTTEETLTVNGVVLNTLAKNITSLTGRLKVPARRNENITVPGRHGRIRTTRKYFDENDIVLPMWVRGCDDDGNITSGREQFYGNIDTLTKLFQPGDGSLEVVHTLPDGSSRRAWAECTEAIDFSMQAGSHGRPLGKFSVALKMPSPFWEETTVTSVDLAVAHTGSVSQFFGTTAPIDDMVLTVTGPATNPRVEALYNDVTMVNPTWLLYSGTVPAGQTLVIDVANWSLAGTGGLTPDYSLFSHQGGATWLTLVPGPGDEAPQVKFTASSTSGATKLNLAARRKFLVG